MHLVHCYTELYVVRFALYMLEDDDLKKSFIDHEWPTAKLKEHCSNGELCLLDLLRIPSALTHLTNLKTLKLVNCSTSHKYDLQVLKQLLRLEGLSLIHCGLSTPSFIADMGALQHLSLKDNKIKSIS